MKWFYVVNDEQRGPVSAAELSELSRTGTVTSQTLVWRDGLENWQPFAAIQSELAEGAAPGGPVAQCAECRRSFPQEDMLSFEKSWVCPGCKPVFFQKLREGLPAGLGAGAWRRQRELVVALNAQLPDRCVKCNQPAGGARLKRKLYWHHPALYILIFFPGLLIYALVAIIVRKTATLQVGLCDAHRKLRHRDMLIGWLLALLGIAAFFGAAAANQGWYVFAGIVLLLFGLIWGVARSRVVIAKKIDTRCAYVGGVCGEYLAELPQWTGE